MYFKVVGIFTGGSFSEIIGSENYLFLLLSQMNICLVFYQSHFTTFNQIIRLTRQDTSPGIPSRKVISIAREAGFKAIKKHRARREGSLAPSLLLT